MTDTNISRHELKIKHRRLIEQAKSIQNDYAQTRRMLQDFNDSYIQLYEYFPLFRYRKLKVLIKNFVAKGKIDDLKKKVQEASEPEKGTRESQTDEVESDSENDGRPLNSGGKPYGLIKQAMRKVEKLCGFDNEPIEDEDVKTDEELLKNMKRKRRLMYIHHEDMARTLQALEILRENYIRFKPTYFPLRFFALKKMVREMILITKPDSKKKQMMRGMAETGDKQQQDKKCNINNWCYGGQKEMYNKLGKYQAYHTNRKNL